MGVYPESYIVLVLNNLVVMQIQSCDQCAQERCVGYDSMNPRNPCAREGENDVPIFMFWGHAARRIQHFRQWT